MRRWIRRARLTPLVRQAGIEPGNKPPAESDREAEDPSLVRQLFYLFKGSPVVRVAFVVGCIQRSCGPERRASLFRARQIGIVIRTCVAAPAVAFRRNFERMASPQKASFTQVLSQCSLYDGGQSRRRFLGSPIIIHGLRKIVGKSHSGSFHKWIVSPQGERDAIGDSW